MSSEMSELLSWYQLMSCHDTYQLVEQLCHGHRCALHNVRMGLARLALVLFSIQVVPSSSHVLVCQLANHVDGVYGNVGVLVAEQITP